MPAKLSDQLEQWLNGEGEMTLGSLIETFGEKSFAVPLVLLLGVPALPLPTGGVTHVFELIAMLVALQLIAGAPRSGWRNAGGGSSSPAGASSASSRG